MTTSLHAAKSEAAAIACPARPGADTAGRAETHSGGPDATHSPASLWWPSSSESKIWVDFGRPQGFFMTLPAEYAAVRGVLVNWAPGQILLHPDLKEHICDWQPHEEVVLRLSLDLRGCVYINPVSQGPSSDMWPRCFDADDAQVIKASEADWVQRRHTSPDRCFVYAARSGRRLPVPKWPSQSFETLLQMAMPGRIISDRSHPAIQSFMKPDSNRRASGRRTARAGA